MDARQIARPCRRARGARRRPQRGRRRRAALAAHSRRPRQDRPRGTTRSDLAAGRHRLHRRPDRLGQEPAARRYRMSRAGRHALGPARADRRRPADPARRCGRDRQAGRAIVAEHEFRRRSHRRRIHRDARRLPLARGRDAAARDVIACANDLAGEKFSGRRLAHPIERRPDAAP